MEGATFVKTPDLEETVCYVQQEEKRNVTKEECRIKRKTGSDCQNAVLAQTRS
jgi:hypothetical protein